MEKSASLPRLSQPDIIALAAYHSTATAISAPDREKKAASLQRPHLQHPQQYPPKQPFPTIAPQTKGSEFQQPFAVGSEQAKLNGEPSTFPESSLWTSKAYK
jgi:hypothetical protein